MCTKHSVIHSFENNMGIQDSDIYGHLCSGGSAEYDFFVPVYFSLFSVFFGQLISRTIIFSPYTTKLGMFK